MIPEFNTVRAINPREHFHYRGKYVIRTEWRGRTLIYDVLTKGGVFVVSGFDLLSLDEKTAQEGIVERLGEKANGR